MFRKQANVKVVVGKNDIDSIIAKTAKSNLKMQIKVFRQICKMNNSKKNVQIYRFAK